MIKKKLNIALLPLFFSPPLNSQASVTNEFDHPFYLGALGGVGSTTWEGLVPSPLNRKALVISTPMLVQEGGPVWGVLAGYEFNPYFAIEGNYTSYRGAEVYFDSNSIYSYYNQGRTAFHTQTDTVSLMAKIMLIIPNTKFRLYSSAGATEIHRQDMIMDKWRLGPSFGVGLNYLISEHLMGEVAGNYATGYGESRLSPADSYFPFLYSVTTRIAYRF